MQQFENLQFEQIIMEDVIVSATGLKPDSIQVGIKGDPSIRESVFERKRYTSFVDTHHAELLPIFEGLLLKRGIYQLFIAFNSNEVRTRSIFDPLREEIHSTEKFLIDGYIERHFPRICYDNKIKAVRSIYHFIKHDTISHFVPSFWKKILQKKRELWQPMEIRNIKKLLNALKIMRNQEDFYLRNVTINLVQSLIRLQFNCDGTQIVDAKNFQQFLEQNMCEIEQ